MIDLSDKLSTQFNKVLTELDKIDMIIDIGSDKTKHKKAFEHLTDNFAEIRDTIELYMVNQEDNNVDKETINNIVNTCLSHISTIVVVLEVAIENTVQHQCFYYIEEALDEIGYSLDEIEELVSVDEEINDTVGEVS